MNPYSSKLFIVTLTNVQAGDRVHTPLPLFEPVFTLVSNRNSVCASITVVPRIFSFAVIESDTTSIVTNPSILFI